MPLPVIIIFHRQFDAMPVQTVRDSLADLAQHGYDTLCVEHPPHHSPHEIRASVNETLAFTENLYQQTYKTLTANHIKVECELFDLDYGKLCELLMLAVSTKRYRELAFNTRYLPALRARKEILDTAERQGMRVQGIDAADAPCDPLYIHGLSRVTGNLEGNPADRHAAMTASLLKLHRRNKGIIFLCDAAHAAGIIPILDNSAIRDQVLYYFLHSSQRFENGMDDIGELCGSQVFNNHQYAVNNTDDGTAFANKLREEISVKYPEYEQAAATTASGMFASFFYRLYAFPDRVRDGSGEIFSPGKAP